VVGGDGKEWIYSIEDINSPGGHEVGLICDPSLSMLSDLKRTENSVSCANKTQVTNAAYSVYNVDVKVFLALN
jgi:hypothetical protein